MLIILVMEVLDEFILLLCSGIIVFPFVDNFVWDVFCESLTLRVSNMVDEVFLRLFVNLVFYFLIL